MAFLGFCCCHATNAVHHPDIYGLLLRLRQPINMIGVMADGDPQQKPPRPALASLPADIDPPANTVEFKPRPETLRTLVHKLALNTGNIGWGKHAQERMLLRGITDKYALDTLRNGMPKGEIVAGQNPGEWKMKMTHRAKGRREVGVVVITVRNERLFVKTVEWEDLI